MFKQRVRLPVEKDYYLSIISGIESGVATTTAIIVGTLTGTDNRRIVLVSSLVALLVQAFNSAMTHITTAHAIDEIENDQGKDSIRRPIAEAGIQFTAHVFSSFIVLLPIVIGTDLHKALLMSVGAALTMLFLLGFIVGVMVRNKPFQNATQTVIIGGLVICIGFVAGLIIQA